MGHKLGFITLVLFSLREISILRELEHPNIVKLIDVIMDEKKLYLVFEFLFMDLKKYIDEQKYQKNRIDVELSRSYMYQMLQVLYFLQSLIINFIFIGSGFLSCKTHYSS